ncbi:MAG: hypothetical protein ACT4N2_02920 [Hyphomicrobium sp.]
MRPLPPFRVKPVRTLAVRRTLTAESIRELAGQEPTGIKPARATLSLSTPARRATLRILGGADNDAT